MVVNTVTEAKARLSALIEQAMSGKEVIIKRAGKPVAVLTRYIAGNDSRSPGALAGKIHIAEDFDSLPDDIETAFGME